LRDVSNTSTTDFKLSSTAEQRVRQQEETGMFSSESLLRIEAKSMCVVCLGRIHPPTLCPRLVHLVRPGGCITCFSPHHTCEDITRHIAGLPEATSADERAREPIVRSCWVVIRDSNDWRSFRPCEFCFLVHPSGEGACSRKDSSSAQSMARAVMAGVFFEKVMLRAFVDELEEDADKKNRLQRSPSEFFQWCVYGGTARIQNLTRLLGWFRKQRKWKV
jgi:hypothetical protein